MAEKTAWNKKEDSSLINRIKRDTAKVNKIIASLREDDELGNQYAEMLRETYGTNKYGYVKASVEDKTHSELVFQARELNRFIKWDKTSNLGVRELNAKAHAQYISYINNSGNKNITEEAYALGVELLGAYNEKGKTYDSEQIINDIDNYVKNDLLTESEILKVIMEYGNEEKHPSMTINQRLQAIRDTLDELETQRRKEIEEMEE